MTWPFQRVYADLGLGDRVMAEAVGLYGIPFVQLADPATRLPMRVVLADLERYMEKLGRKDIGLLAGLAVLPGDFGAVELAARACGTAREGLTVLARGYELLAQGVHLALESRGEHAVLRLWNDPDLPLPPAAVEFSLLAMLRLGIAYLGDGTLPERGYAERVRMTHERVPHAAACDRAFGCPVEFGSFENAIEWPGALLDLPLRTANLAVGGALRARVDALLAATPSRDDFVAQVEKVVAQHLAGGVPSFETVARSLGVSERTLHRKLKSADRTYREICDALRIRLAIYYLEQTRSSLKEIASTLGFGDVHAFHRAFKRATGTTPKQHREAKSSA